MVARIDPGVALRFRKVPLGFREASQLLRSTYKSTRAGVV